MKLTFSEDGWEDYASWLNDRQMLRRIHRLIEDTLRNPTDGIGKPEALRGNLSALWSRRLDAEHRMVYAVVEDAIVIVQLRYHYER